MNIYNPLIMKEIITHIKDCMLELGPKQAFLPTKICLVGSRVSNQNRSGSDLDVAIQYKGNIREDDVFHMLNSEPLFIDDVRVDFIPYLQEKGNAIRMVESHILFT